MSRYDSDGSPDTSFGANGRLTREFTSSWWEEANAVAVQPDGKTVVAGGGNGYFLIARYDPDGTSDTTFGNDGKAMVRVATSSSAQGMALQADGKIVMSGYAYTGAVNAFAVARVRPNGTLDTSFGANGAVATLIGTGSAYARSVAIQADGKIVVAGYAYKDFNRAFALVRYNSDGSLDTIFDGDGKVTTPVGISSEVYSLAFQADGKIVAAGYAWDSGNVDFVLARYNHDGSLDTSFDGDGMVRMRMSNANFYAYGVAIQRDDKILVAGSAWKVTWDIALVRLYPDGSLDTTFNDSGITVTPFGDGWSEARALAIQPDGKIVLAGYASADAKLGLTGVIGLVAKAKICFAMSCNENSKGNETRGCR